jgi:hypothetical protein
MNSSFDDIVYKTFGCSLDRDAFDKDYAAKPEEHDRLNRVALRIWMTLQLRYRFTYEPNPTLRGEDWLLLTYREKPSLEIYLLATCLDTLAHQPGKNLGANQRLNLLFKQLPQDLINWLSNCVVFQEYADTPDLNTKLFKYFFKEWRHPFTHDSITKDSTPSDIELPDANDIWWSFSPDGFLKYRSSLDIATILRVIIYAVVLIKLCGHVSTEQLDAYVRALSKLDTLYKFRWELAHNVRTLRFWSAYTGSVMRLEPLLFNQASRLAHKLFASPIAMERRLSERLAQYLDAIEATNSEVANFEARHPHEPLEIPDTDIYRDTLREFFMTQVGTKAAEFILQMPKDIQVQEIDLFIREVFVYCDQPVAEADRLPRRESEVQVGEEESP